MGLKKFQLDTTILSELFELFSMDEYKYVYSSMFFVQIISSQYKTARICV